MTNHYTKRHNLLEPSPYDADDGHAIGKDPRTLTPDQLRAAGLEKVVGIKAKRAKCLDCCGNQPAEVRKCTATDCALWLFRMGTNPWNAKSGKPEQKNDPAVPIVD